jgi:WD40 repeat protein
MKLGGGADALALNPDGTLLAAGAYDGRLVLLDRPSGKPMGVPLAGHTNMVRAEVFSPDGLTLASGGDDGTVLLWDVPSRQILARFSHGATVLSGDGSARTPLAVNRLHFSPDGRRLAADGPARRVLLWDVDLASWMAQACSAARRDLAQEEWRRYVGEQDAYRPTCPGGKPRT